MTLPPAFGETLPGRHYVDGAVFAREQARIFGEMWVCAGRSDDVARPGAFACATIAGDSVVVVRAQSGRLRAFYNVCPHRGAPLCSEPRGQVASLRCPYHAWTYSLDGELVGAPMLRELREHGFDLARAALRPVGVASWHGMLWINLAGETAGDVAAQLEPLLAERFGDPAVFAGYGLDRLGTGTTIAYDVAANWKLLIENFLECSHCAPMHPELCRAVPAFGDGIASATRGDLGVTLGDSFEAFSLTGTRTRPVLPGLGGGEARRIHAVVLLPNVLLLLTPDHVVSLVLCPEGPDRTRVRCDWLFDRQAIAQPDFDPADAVALFDRVNRQDWRVMELTQRSMGSRAWRTGGVIAASEHALAGFRRFVLDRLAETA